MLQEVQNGDVILVLTEMKTIASYKKICEKCCKETKTAELIHCPYNSCNCRRIVNNTDPKL